MARRSTRWMGLFVSAAFATAAVALLTAADHNSTLPGSPIPPTEMDQLLGAGARYLICDTTTTGPICTFGYFCSGMDCATGADCEGCSFGANIAFCSPTGAGFFDTCEDTTMSCGDRDIGKCAFLDDVCVCLVTGQQGDCIGPNRAGGC